MEEQNLTIDEIRFVFVLIGFRSNRKCIIMYINTYYHYVVYVSN